MRKSLFIGLLALSSTMIFAQNQEQSGLTHPPFACQPLTPTRAPNAGANL